MNWVALPTAALVLLGELREFADRRWLILPPDVVGIHDEGDGWVLRHTLVVKPLVRRGHRSQDPTDSAGPPPQAMPQVAPGAEVATSTTF